MNKCYALDKEHQNFFKRHRFSLEDMIIFESFTMHRPKSVKVDEFAAWFLEQNPIMRHLNENQVMAKLKQMAPFVFENGNWRNG